MSNASKRIKPSFTVKQALELARLCYQFRNYPVISDCYKILFEAAVEQATPDAIKAETLPEAVYFPEYIDG